MRRSGGGRRRVGRQAWRVVLSWRGRRARRYNRAWAGEAAAVWRSTLCYLAHGRSSSRKNERTVPTRSLPRAARARRGQQAGRQGDRRAGGGGPLACCHAGRQTPRRSLTDASRGILRRRQDLEFTMPRREIASSAVASPVGSFLGSARSMPSAGLARRCRGPSIAFLRSPA